MLSIFGRLLPFVRTAVSVFAAVAAAAPLYSAHTPQPASVTIAGSLQDELGCPGDWDPACAATHLALDGTDGVWQASFVLPAGTYEYKVALNDSWTENYGAGAVADGPNVVLTLASSTTVKFYYSHASHWITSSANDTIATAVGNFQSELGCSGDWQPDCLRSWLQDQDGDGTYEFSTSALTAGAYEAKVAISENWGENYGQGGASGGANIPFHVPFDNAEMLFSYSGTSHVLTIGARQGAHDDSVSSADLLHDSRASVYRTPGGPVTAGTALTVRLRALAGDLTDAQVRIFNDRTNSESVVEMTLAANDGQYDWWEATLETGVDPTILWYRFVARDGSGVAYYDDDVARDGGTGTTNGETTDIRWQITSYDAAFTTPDWARNGIVYQIFPDRFRNGNAANDTPQGTFFYGEAGGTIRRSAQTNWNMPICDPRDSAGPCFGKFSSNFYGGDLQGIIDQLPYLEELGVTVLYVNPIFESPSNHKYDTTDYLQIDDNLGDLTVFQTLTSEAHARGMKVVLDGVFNHTSSDSKYFDRYGRYAAPAGACEDTGSPFRSWFFFTAAPAPGSGVCAGDTLYESWFGYESLPKLNSAIAATRELIWDDPGSVARYWLAQGADGWRLDVAGDIDPGATADPSNDYWEGFRSAVRAQKSDAWIVGEEWGLATPWTLGGEWDSAMNYQFSSAVLGFWRDEPFVDNDHESTSAAGVLAPLTPSQLDARLHNLAERYPPASLYAMMNILGSHDTNRALFMLDHNADLNNPAIYENPSYDWTDAITRLKGAALLQMTLPGAPAIYYGDEIGLVGAVAYSGGKWEDDPYNRQPYPWLDESGTPFYPHLQNGGAGDDLRAYYKLLTTARNAHPALRTGSFDTLLVDDANDVYAYGRKLADATDAAVAVINRGDTDPRTIAVNVGGYLSEGAEFHDVLNSNAVHTVTGGVLTVDVPARGGALLVLASTLATAPAEVTDLAVSAIGSSSVTLSWSAASGASDYDVYTSLLSGGGYTLHGSTSTPGYTAGGLTPTVRYHFVVVSRNATTGLISDNSNEVSAVPTWELSDPTAWFNIQWPPSIMHQISTTTLTESIYGRIFIPGATESAGPPAGVRAQVGYGPDGTQPGSAWHWFEMMWYSQAGNDDEYVGSLLPDETGDYDYAARYSSDDGTTWWYADLSGPQRDGILDNPGQLTVVASDDITAPATPEGVLVALTLPSEIRLAWSPNSEEDLAGYEIFREVVGGGYTRIAAVAPGATSYSDFSVAPGASYRYYVKAYDTSFNRSPASNVVEAAAAVRHVDVTFHITVPSFTPSADLVYITGSLADFGPWSAGAAAATKIDATHWTYTVPVVDGTTFDYKFTRGTFDTVETMADGNGDVTRQWTASYGSTGSEAIHVVVANWRDPIVVSLAPAAGAADVSTATTVAVTWSQQMPANSDFAVSVGDRVVPGTFAYSAGTQTTTFTPGEPLLSGTTYSVAVSGKRDAANDLQQVAVHSTFTTACSLTPPTISAGGPTTFCDGGSVTLTSSSATGNQWYRNGVLLPGETMQTLVAAVAGSYTVTTTTGSCTSAASSAAMVAVSPRPNATIAVPSSVYAGASATASVNVSCTDATFSWSIAGGTITAGSGTPRVTFSAGAAGTLTLTITVANAFGCSDTKSADVTVQLAPFGPPPFFRATGSAAAVAIEWSGVESAHHYDIERSTDNSTWSPAGTSNTMTFTDSGLAASKTYFYRVRAVKADATVSSFSATDAATTVTFSNDPIPSCPVVIKTAHILELRQGINAARASVGYSQATFTDLSLAPGALIKAAHVTELRSALAPVLDAIGVAPSYTDPVITPGLTTAKAAHINELRDLIR